MSRPHSRATLALAIAASLMLAIGCTSQSTVPASSGSTESHSTTPTDDSPQNAELSDAPAAADATANLYAPVHTPEPTQSPPPTVVVDLSAGTQLEVELLNNVSSGTSQAGDPVSGRLISAVYADGKLVAPAGAEVEGVITAAVPLKKFGGQPSVSIMFESLTVDDGSRVPVLASHTAAGKKQAGRDTAKIGGSAAVGAVIGHQVDDDNGTEIGALLGGAIGTAAAAKTGKELELPAGTPIIVVLEFDVQIRMAP
jgi:hypothetical protein